MGVDADTVESMRDSGLSWLEVCRAMGVSPGVLGGAVDNESEEGTISKALDSLLGSRKTADPKADKDKESGKSNSAGNSTAATAAVTATVAATVAATVGPRWRRATAAAKISSRVVSPGYLT